jgi:hypothetical protein
MPGSARTAAATRADARARLKTATAYVEVGELVLDERERQEFLNVSAGLAVLAGIAAADSICAARLQQIHRGQDHRGAAVLLEAATSDGKTLARLLRRLLDIKDAAHYGVAIVERRRAGDAIRWARQLTERARQELER